MMFRKTYKKVVVSYLNLLHDYFSNLSRFAHRLSSRFGILTLIAVPDCLGPFSTIDILL